MTSNNLVSPSDDEVISAIRTSRIQNATLGVVKLQASVLAANPSWALSEARIRKILKKHGLGLANNNTAQSLDAGEQTPISRLNDELDLARWSSKVKVSMFDARKGKGLVATEDIKEGEIIWKEEPFVYCAAWCDLLSNTSYRCQLTMNVLVRYLQDAQALSRRCASCALPMATSKFSPVPCPQGCRATWCSLVCSTRAKAAHPFLCPMQNPASVPLMQLARTEEWIALGAWARVVALLLGEWVTSPNVPVGTSASWSMVRGLAAMSLRERLKALPNWYVVRLRAPKMLIDLFRQSSTLATEVLWKKAHQHFIEAFDAPPDPASAKKLAKLKKSKALPPDIHQELFGYEDFLVGLGRMSLSEPENRLLTEIKADHLAAN